MKKNTNTQSFKSFSIIFIKELKIQNSRSKFVLFFVLFFLCSFLSSCDFMSSSLKKDSEIKYLRTLIKTDFDKVKVPILLSDIIAKKYINYIQTITPQAQDSHTKAKLKANIPRTFLRVRVKLKEKTKAVLKGQHLISFSTAGGLIDLSHYLSGSPGSFLVQFELFDKSERKKREELLKSLMIFYSSHTKKTRFGLNTPGTACGKLLEITSYISQIMNKKGLIVRVEKKRGDHIEFLGGNFYFTFFKKNRLFIGVVGFRDSRFPELRCR